MLLAIGALVVWAGPEAPDQARAEGRLIVQNSGALNAYLKGIETARLQLDGACELLRGATRQPGNSATLTLSLNGETPEIRGLERLGVGEKILARTALRVVQALARLGLTSPKGQFILRIEEAGLYVGSATRGGRVFADPCVGLGHLLKLIINASDQAPAGLRAAAAGNSTSGLLNDLRGQARDIAILGRGSVGRARIESLSGNSQDLNFSGTPGITVIEIVISDDQSIELILAIDDQVPVGDGAVFAYKPSDRFTPVSRYPVRIVEAPAERTQPRPPPPSLTPGSSVEDRLEANGETRAFAVAVEHAGILVIESSGSTDLAAGLMGPSGQVLNSNDDGGTAYNFRIEQPVEPGQYRLDVTHCCGGAGSYGLSVQLK